MDAEKAREIVREWDTRWSILKPSSHLTAEARGYLSGLKGPEVKALFETGNAIEDILEVPPNLGAHSQHVMTQAIDAFRAALENYRKAVDK